MRDRKYIFDRLKNNEEIRKSVQENHKKTVTL